jgi:hypothetical protein
LAYLRERHTNIQWEKDLAATGKVMSYLKGWRTSGDKISHSNMRQMLDTYTKLKERVAEYEDMMGLVTRIGVDSDE